MTDQSSPPSIDPASRLDLAGTVRFILNKFLQGVDDMLPAQVISYNRTTNQAIIQPLINVVTTNNQVITRAPVSSIQVLQLGGGGFVLSFPLNKGDLGWIKASDRDISLFKKVMAAASPNTDRLHSFEDALFIPDTMLKSVTINSEDAANVVLQTTDGTVRVALFPDHVKITAPKILLNAGTEIDITSPVIKATASTSITLDSPLTTITGALTAGTGAGADANFGGRVIATGDVIGAGKSLDTHVHSGVMSGGSNTGPPV